jgi:hypothetical protein
MLNRHPAALGGAMNRIEELAMTPAIFLIAIAASLPATHLESVCQSARLGVLPGQDQASAFQTCVQDEKTARDQLRQEWPHFSALARDTCAEPAGVTFSYVELLTCLEMQPGSQFGISQPPGASTSQASDLSTGK